MAQAELWTKTLAKTVPALYATENKLVLQTHQNERLTAVKKTRVSKGPHFIWRKKYL